MFVTSDDPRWYQKVYGASPVIEPFDTYFIYNVTSFSPPWVLYARDKHSDYIGFFSSWAWNET